MGMDVYGIGNEKAYFRANIWSWRPIHSLISKFASDLVDEDTIRLMSANDGAGITNPDDCVKLANRIENWMEHNVDGLNIDVTEEAEQSIEKIVNDIISMVTSNLEEGDNYTGIKYGDSDKPKYRVNDDHLKEFVEFLRVCKGFKVL